MSSAKESQRIRQVLFVIDKNRNYKFDVNQTTTIKGLKRIISVAANLGKVGLKIFHKGVEYSEEEDSTLSELFPDQQLTEFTVSISKVSLYDSESKIKLKLGDYCNHHMGKYLYFYCYDCSESICSSCVTSDMHKSHKIIEKYDYLQSSKHLVDLMFSDMTNFISGLKFDKKEDAEELKKKIRNVYFPGLHELLIGVENKMVDLIENTVETTEKSFSNLKQNITLIREHCTQGLDKLKEEIRIEDMMMNQEIFMIFDKKYKEIESEKNRIIEDKKKFAALNESFINITETVEKIYSEIYGFLEAQNKNPVFSDLKKSICFDKSVVLVNKEEIIQKLLSDVKLNKTGKKSMIARAAKSTVPSIPILSQLREVSPIKNIEIDDNILSSIFDNKQYDGSKKVEQPISVFNKPSRKAQSLTGDRKTKEKENVENPNLISVFNNNINSSQKTYKIIMRCETNTNSIIFYNDETNELGRLDVVFPTFSKLSHFLPNSCWVNHKGKLYMTGGQLGQNSGSDAFLCYDFASDKLTMLPDMICGRYSHSMIYNNNSIYVVGGDKNNTCEKYDFSTMKWIKLNTLSLEERQSSILYVNNNYLYCFFGYAIGSYLDSVERIKLGNNKAKWEIVPYKNPDKINLKLIGCGVVRYDDHSIIFLGGRNANESRTQAFKYDFSTSTFSLAEINLEDYTYFQESALEELEDASYGQFDNEYGDNFLKLQIN